MAAKLITTVQNIALQHNCDNYTKYCIETNFTLLGKIDNEDIDENATKFN